MNLGILKFLGHQINLSKDEPVYKQCLWAAFTLGFFSSCRMGEILSKNVKSFNPLTTFQWKHVRFNSKGDVMIRLPATKTKGLEGEIIDIFPYPHDNCCPVAALRKLWELQVEKGFFCLNSPVFSFSPGSFLTCNKLNTYLKFSLQDIFLEGSNSISCHSFRGAIPSVISSYSNKSYIEEVKEWGRWKGDSFKTYAKLSRDKKLALYQKVCHILKPETVGFM